MLNIGLKTYPGIEAFIVACSEDKEVRQTVAQFYPTTTLPELKVLLELSLQEQKNDKVLCINLSVQEPLVIGGIEIKASGAQCLLVGTFCRGNDLIAVYSVNGAAMQEMVRVANSASCFNELTTEDEP